MKIKYLQLIKMLSKFTIYGILLQACFFTFLFAEKGEAQNKSIREVYVIVKDSYSSVSEILNSIESQTEFEFAYSTKTINGKKSIRLTPGTRAVNEVLFEISRERGLKFKQVNNSISVKKLRKPQSEMEFIVEVIQTRTITGTVTDENKEELPGVNVIVKGTQIGTVTDINGSFSIEVPDDNTVLIFSSVGYITEEVAVGSRTSINMALTPDITSLDEIVVIGYGTQKRANVTAAISTVESKDLKITTSANTASLLQGKVTGVNVENSGGAPGTGAVVVIRGSGTLSNSDQPLYVVDGSIVGSIAFLNPEDIESMQVLKDASAAAIYGNRAANGVVIVTTKKGVKGKVRINVNSKVGIQSTTNRLNFLNGEEYIDARNQAITNGGGGPDDLLTWNGVSTDWQDVQLSDALFQDHNFNVSGGGERGTYFFSGQYLSQDGIVNSSGYERFGLRANSTFKKGKFAMDQNFWLSREVKDVNSYYYREFGPPPIQEVYDENNEGGFAGAPSGFASRPVNWFGVSELIDDESIIDRAILNLTPSFEIIKGLTYKYNLSINYNVFHNYVFSPTFFISGSPGGSNDIARLTESYTRAVDILQEHTLFYENSIGDHSFSVLGGYTTQKGEARSAGGVATEFGSNDLRTLSAGNVDTDVFGSLGENALVSFLGRLTYSFRDKYLVSASIRQDETSRFIEANRKGSFPSFSLGWRISEEPFFPVDGAISELKIRGSWGQLGNQNVGNYDTQSTINIQNGYAIGGVAQNGATVLNLSNPDLFWETTTSSNIGFDMELLEGKLSFIADYFIKETADILVNLPIPTGGGQGSSIRTNSATMENRGFELGLNYKQDFGNDFSMNSFLNFTTLKNEVTSLGEGVSPIIGGRFNQGGLFATRTDVGHPIASFYGHVMEGIYQNIEEIEADGRVGEADLGDINFKDLDNDGDIDDDDRDFLGSAVPEFQIGFNISLNYKNFDLNMFINSVQGVELWNTRWNDNFFLSDEGGDIFAEAKNAWTPSNTDTNIPIYTESRSANNSRPSDFYVEDGSYTRLKNIEVGYTVPSNVFPENTIAGLRVYVSAQNILTFTNYSGYDPEIGRSFAGGAVGSSNGSIFGAGIDRAYPNAKTVFFGLQISF